MRRLAAAGAMDRSTNPLEALLETLVSRGWCLRDAEEVRTLIGVRAAAGGDQDVAVLTGAVEAQLLNLDLRSFGGKVLPDPSAMKKSSRLLGPMILQVVSVNDIYLSSIETSFKNSRHRRLLRFGLTDGHTEVIALEYTPIPSINEDVIPGTKVLLQNKVAVHNGILCLTPKVVTILGGHVQSLYDEWQMSQKYSGFSRSSFKLSQNNEGMGPPPFEKLQLEAFCSQPQSSRGSQSMASSLLKDTDVRRGAKNHDVLVMEVKEQFRDSKSNSDQKMASATRAGDEESTSNSRPKEVIEAIPVQNQAAAQKLLQKLNQPTHDNRHHRGSKYRGKGKQEETAVFTLDEWERRKAISATPVGTSEVPDVSRDEELARQLQSRLDFEDCYVAGNSGTYDTEAEKIKISMFNFGGTGEMNHDRGESRQRGRGRGRWRGRERGRMRGRFD